MEFEHLNKVVNNYSWYFNIHIEKSLVPQITIEKNINILIQK